MKNDNDRSVKQGVEEWRYMTTGGEKRAIRELRKWSDEHVRVPITDVEELPLADILSTLATPSTDTSASSTSLVIIATSSLASASGVFFRLMTVFFVAPWPAAALEAEAFSESTEQRTHTKPRVGARGVDVRRREVVLSEFEAAMTSFAATWFFLVRSSCGGSD